MQQKADCEALGDSRGKMITWARRFAGTSNTRLLPEVRWAGAGQPLPTLDHHRDLEAEENIDISKVCYISIIIFQDNTNCPIGDTCTSALLQVIGW